MRFRNQRMRRIPTLLVPRFLRSSAVRPTPRRQGDGKCHRGQEMFEEGKEGVSPCQSCHGPQGLGIDAMQTRVWPTLVTPTSSSSSPISPKTSAPT